MDGSLLWNTNPRNEKSRVDRGPKACVSASIARDKHNAAERVAVGYFTCQLPLIDVA